MRKTGAEYFAEGGLPLALNLLDFWQWAYSDLVNNTTRGVLAEYIVGSALKADLSGIRDPWAPYDLTTPHGTKVEVKSAAYSQTWKQKRPSIINFVVKLRRPWNGESGGFGPLGRNADVYVYVFALLAEGDKARLNPLDVNQWQFYVAPRLALDARERSQHSITLVSLNKEFGPPVHYANLHTAVSKAHHANGSE